MACSVSGCIIFKRRRSARELSQIESKLRNIIVRGEDRGRDSYGIISLTRNEEIKEIKAVGKPSESLHKKSRFVFRDTTIVLNNDRAEPTTEYVPKKEPHDIQPFGERFIVSHNGIIANDKDLERRYGLNRHTAIDTAVLPPLLEKTWDGKLESLRNILRDVVVGSFALVIVDRKNPRVVYLACNYKPLFLEYDTPLDTLFFTSLESYLQDQSNPLWHLNPSRQMEPYSVTAISTDKNVNTLSLWPDKETAKRRALVVCSAGLDSTTAAKVIIDQGYDVTLLHFRYRHRAEQREAERIQKIADVMKCGLMIVDTDVFKNVIKHSRLTETYDKVVTERHGEAGAELAYEWVPARNLIFLSMAVGIAEGHGFDVIVLGNNNEESSAYPDNEMIFVNKLNDVLPYATNYQKRVRIEMPVGNLVKHEIVKLGVSIGAPLALTWSCYEGREYHCGTCGPCYMRRKAFTINGLKDPVQYEDEILTKINEPR